MLNPHTYEPVSKSEEAGPLSTFETKQPHDGRCLGRCCRRCCCCLYTTFALYLLLFVSISVVELIQFNRSPEKFLERNYVGGPISVPDLLLKRAGYRMDVPLWMQKNLAIEVPVTDKTICFVHVGKTAGSTLACYFGFLYPECAAYHSANETVDAMPMAPGILPAATTHLVHTSYNDCADQDFDYYLFVLRDPLKRIQSWFNYELPENGRWSGSRLHAQQQLFIDCNFHTLNSLGEMGLAPRRTSNASELCQDRAHMAIKGTVGYSTHNYYNFGYYLGDVKNHTDLPVHIVVIRTEHLASDWKSIEGDILHGPKDLNVTFTRKRNASPTRPEVTYLSPIAKQRICAALCQEIQVYKSLLQAAINLNVLDIAQSMTELEDSCPVETRITVCEPEIP